uniref:KAP family P-loop NTPase fold protein n=1 Tax=Mycobacterium paraintracellulare TaxID=1138383 RepID=UPI001F411F9E
MTADELRLQLWDDNPSLVDFLGFDAVVAPIIAAIGTPDIDPLAIGVHSPWGGGKSTVLNLLEKQLSEQPQYLVVRADPWQYDNHDDVRGDLIVEVLDQVEARFNELGTVTGAVKDLVKRLSWSRIGLTLGKGALTMQWKVDELVEAFTPRGRTDDRSMAGFKDQFATLIDGLPHVQRVVVLVDDLDRCLPPAVMATLEAIKLFLAVPKMVFVIAADQEMVRESIAVSLGETNRSNAFAVRYLEKIVQIPVSLPRLAPSDAEAYTGLLLAAAEAATPDDLVALADQCSARRKEGLLPLLGDLGELAWSPTETTLALATQLAQGLSADRLANPRQIKRFLNAFGVRQLAAKSRSVDIEPAVLIKMLLLEDLFRSSFQTLASTPPAQRADLLSAWELWAAGADIDAEKPDGIAAETRDWAAAPPSLATKRLDRYLDLAASLINVGAGEQVSDNVIRLGSTLLGLAQLDQFGQRGVAGGLALTEQRAAQ